MWLDQQYQREGVCQCCGNPLKQSYSERLPDWCGACNVLYKYILQAVQGLGENQARTAIATVLNLAVQDHASKTKRPLVVTERADFPLHPPEATDRFDSRVVVSERVQNCGVVAGQDRYRLRYLPASDQVGPIAKLDLTSKLDGTVSTIEFGRQEDERCHLEVSTGVLWFSLELSYQYHMVVTYLPLSVDAP